MTYIPLKHKDEIGNPIFMARKSTRRDDRWFYVTIVVLAFIAASLLVSFL